MPKVTELEAGTFSIPDVIEPSSADFTNKDYVSMDGIEGLFPADMLFIGIKRN